MCADTLALRYTMIKHSRVSGLACRVVQCTREYAAELITAGNKNSVPGEKPHKSMLDQVAEEMLWAVRTMARKTSAHTGPEATAGAVPEVGR